jgi:hypothetical protein
MTSLPKIAFRNSSPPARPASRVSPWHAALLGLLVLGALLVLGGCLAEEGTGTGGATAATWAEVSTTLSSEGCLGCHAGSAYPNMTACSVVSNGFFAAPGDPASSVLYLVANGDLSSPNGSTTMTFGSAGNLATLESWINGGAVCP